MFGAEVDVDDALAFVRRAHGQVLVPIFIDVSKIGQRESEPERGRRAAKWRKLENKRKFLFVFTGERRLEEAGTKDDAECMGYWGERWW